MSADRGPLDFHAKVRAMNVTWGLLRRRPSESASCRRVEMWRGGGRLLSTVAAPFGWRCRNQGSVTPFPHPASSNRASGFPALGSRTRYSSVRPRKVVHEFADTDQA